MRRIEVQLFRRIVSVSVFVIIEALLIWLMLYIFSTWLPIGKMFIKIMLSCIVATPVSLVVYKAMHEAWTGERIE
ncbi:MAG TPA: hypothetical protein IAC34_01670 [Candidatus Coprenecus stercoripullorum]|nr:hypothetical protein [Candidatus Coprenecus stercoripullorum]